MRRVLSDDKGLTLIETLVTLAIMASIAGVLVSFQWVSLNQWRRGDSQAEVQQSVRIGLNRMVSAARAAKDIQIYKVGAATYLRCIYKQENGVATDFKEYSFTPGSGVLYEQNGISGERNQVALLINQFSPTWADDKRKTIDIVLSGQSPDDQTFSLETRVAPRLLTR